MPSRSEIERERDRYARASDNLFIHHLNELEGPLWIIIGSLLDSLSTNNQGRLLFNIRNISTANQVGVAVQSFNVSRGFSVLGWVFNRLNRLFRLNRQYFNTMPELQPETVEDRVRRLILTRYGFNPDTNTINQNGYLAANLRQGGQSQAITQRINQAIAARMPLNQFKKQFRQDFNKAGSPLSLKFHYNRFARDLFQEFDRTTQLEYANELGLNHAIYSGTIKNNTRCFCKRRTNRLYSDEFMSKWNGQQWQGKKPGVDVRIALGGYNCRHVLSWVTEETAEILSMRRKMKKNTYNKVIC